MDSISILMMPRIDIIKMLLRVLIILDIVVPKIGNKGILSGRWELST
jgi:hypothetical protein